MTLSRQMMVRGAAIAFATAMCGNAAAQDQQPPQAVADGLQRMQGSRVALTYLRPGTNWTRYRTIMLKNLVVPADARSAAPFENAADTGESSMLSSGAVAQLQTAFAVSMKDVLGDSGYTFVTTPQADTLIVAPRVISTSEGNGAITVAAVLADGSSGDVIAEVRDRKYGSNVGGTDDGTIDLAQAGDAFDQWAGDLRNTLQWGPASQHPLLLPVNRNPELDSAGATAP